MSPVGSTARYYCKIISVASINTTKISVIPPNCTQQGKKTSIDKLLVFFLSLKYSTN